MNNYLVPGIEAMIVNVAPGLIHVHCYQWILQISSTIESRTNSSQESKADLA